MALTKRCISDRGGTYQFGTFYLKENIYAITL